MLKPPLTLGKREKSSHGDFLVSLALVDGGIFWASLIVVNEVEIVNPQQMQHRSVEIVHV